MTARWEEFTAGATALPEYGTPLPEPLLASIRKNKVALKGPITTPIGEGFTSVNVGLRKALALYANLRPVWNLPSVPSRFKDVDLVIVRENTEDLYAGLEHEVVKGVVESLKIITEKASTQIARFAFAYARRHGRRVTAVHKANIMKLSDGLFIACARKIAKEYTDIQYDERIVDAACMHLVMHPETVRRAAAAEPVRRHRVRPCAGLVGGLGVVPAANLGGRRWRVRSRARLGAGYRRPEQSQSDRAAFVQRADAAAHLNEDEMAARIMAALWAVLADGSGRTADIGGTATTTQFTDAICRVLQS